MSTVLIYRPLGDHPPRTKMGELELGRVHSLSDTTVTRDGKRVTVTGEERAALYFGKGFVVMPPEAKTANAATLASMYEIAKKAADEAATKADKAKPATDAAPPLANLSHQGPLEFEALSVPEAEPSGRRRSDGGK